MTESSALPSLQKETSESERREEARAEGAGVGKRARRFATNWDGTGAAKWADLSRTREFVPIFWTNDLIWYKSDEEDKKLACFVSKIHSHRGSTLRFRKPAVNEIKNLYIYF